MNQDQGKYAFLELLTEGDAIARGANLTDKVNHTVFKTIQGLSTRLNARQNRLFTISTPVPEVINLTEKNLVNVLQRLMGDRVIAQIFRLEYDPGNLEPTLVPCYLSVPQDDRENTFTIYNESMLASVSALESLLNNRTLAKKEEIVRDLEFDFKSERVPTPTEIPATIVDFLHVVHASKFPVLPTPEIINQGIADIRQELSRRGKVRNILNYGLMPIRPDEIIPRFETAGEFLTKKIVPTYRSKGNLKGELEAIHLEEQNYKSGEFIPQTAQFIARRAEAVKKTVSSEPGKGGRFRGSLSVETILSLAADANQKYDDLYQQETLKIYRDYREGLMKVSNDWRESILFFDTEEKQDIPPNAWKHLVEDMELIYGVWELPVGTQHVFVRRDPAVFRILVNGMSALGSQHRWQVLAMRQLLEENENEFRELFEDPEFITSYGRLLRQVYIDFMPWYHRMLLIVGIHWFMDSAFAIAKKKIQGQQSILRSGNEARTRELKQEREQERQQKISRLKDVTQGNQILEILDRFLMERAYIASLEEVRSELPEMDPRTFDRVIESQNFQLLRPGSNEGDTILLYPVDQEWRTRVARLRRVLERVEHDRSHDSRQMERLNRIRKFLARNADSRKAEPETVGSNPDEAYRKFGVEVEKVRKKERTDQPYLGE